MAHSPARWSTLGEPTFPYKTWRIIYMWNKTLARLEPAKAAASPFFDRRITLLTGPTFLHINFLAHPARSTRSRRDNQSMRERFWQICKSEYCAYDFAWQSLNMAAAAACRGSTASGRSGSWENNVMTRNTADRKTCAQICAQTVFRNWDAEVSIYGKKGKATKNGMIVGAFYNYDCNHAVNGGSEESSFDETVMN